MSEAGEQAVGKEPGPIWGYVIERATPDPKMIEQNEQVIAELKSIAANMERIAALIQKRFGELEQSH